MERESVRLGQEAFGRCSEPRRVFEFGAFRRAHEQLLSLLRAESALCFVVGRPGAGKTTLARRTAETLASEGCGVVVWPPEDAEGDRSAQFADLLESAVRERDWPDRAAIPAATPAARTAPTAGAAVGARPRPVFILDAADDLSDEFLLEACRRVLEQPARPRRVQLVLVCSVELARRLDGQLGGQGGTGAEHVQLRRMNDEDVAAYVNTRLAAAGAADREVFPPPTIRLITLYGKGNPGRINALCRQSLLLAHRDGCAQVPVRCVHEAAASPVVAEDPPQEEPLSAAGAGGNTWVESGLDAGTDAFDEPGDELARLRESGNPQTVPDLGRTGRAAEPPAGTEAAAVPAPPPPRRARRRLVVGGLAAAAVVAIVAAVSTMGEAELRPPPVPPSPPALVEPRGGPEAWPEARPVALSIPADREEPSAVADLAVASGKPETPPAGDPAVPATLAGGPWAGSPTVAAAAMAAAETGLTGNSGLRAMASGNGAAAAMEAVVAASSEAARVKPAEPLPVVRREPEMPREPVMPASEAAASTPIAAALPGEPQLPDGAAQASAGQSPPVAAYGAGAAAYEPAIGPAEDGRMPPPRDPADAPAAMPHQPPAAPAAAMAQAPDASAAPLTRPPPAPWPVASDTKMLMERGNGFLAEGDIASARRFYEFAARQGSAEAATALARTYDPLHVEASPIAGVRPDPDAAVAWYRIARDLGAAGVESRLRALAGDAADAPRPAQPGN
jgi:type II secretory pathway predicted ATPase ExeA